MEFSATGTYESQIGCAGSSACSGGSDGEGELWYPEGITIDSSGNIWVADVDNNRVEEFSATGTYELQVGCALGACSSGAGNGQFWGPHELTADANGNVWVGDNGNYRVEEFSATGTYLGQSAH